MYLPKLTLFIFGISMICTPKYISALISIVIREYLRSEFLPREKYLESKVMRKLKSFYI